MTLNILYASSMILVLQVTYFKNIKTFFKWNTEIGFENIALFTGGIVDSPSVTITDHAPNIGSYALPAAY